ncbi:MAG: DUF4386 domain-containing protein [Promethearchaeota archaeon]
MTNRIPDKSLCNAARVNGYGILIMLATGPFAFIVLSILTVPGDAATTANNIKANEWLFSIAIVSFLIVITIDVLFAQAFYVIFKPVNKNLALLAAFFRLMHAIIFAISMGFLFSVLLDQSYALVYINAFNNGYMIGQTFFFVPHLLVLGYLVLKSGHIPRIMGVLLIIGASLGYLLDGITYFLFPNYAAIAYPGLAVATIAELSLSLWLFLKGAKIPEMNTEIDSLQHLKKN